MLSDYQRMVEAPMKTAYELRIAALENRLGMSEAARLKAEDLNRKLVEGLKVARRFVDLDAKGDVWAGASEALALIDAALSSIEGSE